jgi:CubicO group peptidase (beta-lactamase class C family)
MDEKRLNEALEVLRKGSRDGVRQAVVLYRGETVYAGEEASSAVHGVWSVTKSFVSTCLGLLIADGKASLSTQACEIDPPLRKDYPQATLRHFVTMTSGYRAIGDEPQGSYTHGPSLTPFQPSTPLFTPPGSRYAYWDSAMNQLARLLTRVAGEPLQALFKRRIADPIGMKSWEWGTTGEIDGIPINGGAGNLGKHIQISAVELAKLGQLYLDDGRGPLSAEWIREATRVQVAASIENAHPQSGIGGSGVYGYNWWANGTLPSGQRLWPGVPEGTFAAAGHNNNRLFVVPEWNLVVVRLGLDESAGRVSNETWGRFVEGIGRSLEK